MTRVRRKPLPRHCERNRGRIYFRQSRSSPRTRLPDDPASLDFKEQYARLFAGLPPEGAARRSVLSPAESLGWLIKLYLASPKFRSYDTSTQAQRRRQLERLGGEKGDVPLELIDQAAIKAAMAKRQDKIAAANAWLTTVSNMFAWATGEFVVDSKTGKSKPICLENPCETVKRFDAPKNVDLDEEDGHVPWSLEDQARFEAAYPHGKRERLIYEVAHETGLRVGDLARVGRQHVKRDAHGEFISLKTEKTGTPVAVVISTRLKDALERGPKGLDTELAFLTGKHGKAMQKGYLGNFLRSAAAKAGLADRSAHGLRKSLAMRLAEEGMSANELMAIFGWRTIAMAEKYTRGFDRERTALRAMRTGKNSPADSLIAVS